MRDSPDFQQFLDAQEPVYARVCAELRAGTKQSHWMWFIFPQIAGLGSSSMARRFALPSVAAARAYIDHPVLGQRLIECCRLVNGIEDKPIDRILGYPDDLKFRSCVTLFLRAAPEEPVFREALDKYYGGDEDPLTLDRLR